MKTINKGIIAAAILGVSALAGTAAQAADGLITINGKIASQTCTITSSGVGKSFTVTLPTVQTTAFTAAGSVAGRTGFSLFLDGCVDSMAAAGSPVTGNVSAFFEQGNTVNVNNGYLLNATGTGKAGNVNVQLLNADAASNDSSVGFDLRKDGTVMVGGNTLQGSHQVPITGGKAQLDYAAQYVAVGAVPTPGDVNTQVWYSINYN